eukprot:6214471-Pleurochrysis_carterae.AAC.3
MAAKLRQPRSVLQRTAAGDACIHRVAKDVVRFAAAVRAECRNSVGTLYRAREEKECAAGSGGRTYVRRDRLCGGRAEKEGRRLRGVRAAGQFRRAEEAPPQH